MVESLSPGTHLTTPRAGYVHHGLYAGEGRVVQYGGFARGWRRGPVEEVPLAAFERGRGFTVIDWPDARFTGSEAVARARTRLGEDRYSLFTNNCEHFVTWCRTGTARSHQVEALQLRLVELRAGFAGLVRRMLRRTDATSLASRRDTAAGAVDASSLPVLIAPTYR